MKAHPSKSNCRNSRRLDFPGGLQYETATHTGDALKDHWNLLYMHTLTPGGKFVPFSTPPIDRLAAARCTCPSPKMQHYTSLERLYYAHHNIQPLQMWPLIHSRNSIQQHFFLQIFSFIGGASNNNQLGTVYIIGGSEMRGEKTKRPSNTRFYMTPSPFFSPLWSWPIYVSTLPLVSHLILKTVKPFNRQGNMSKGQYNTQGVYIAYTY
jgi:hypothetical protein